MRYVWQKIRIFRFPKHRVDWSKWTKDRNEEILKKMCELAVPQVDKEFEGCAESGAANEEEESQS